MPAYVEDTIVALATPPGVGAVAVVRLSGRAALDVAARVLRRDPHAAADVPPRLESHRARLAVFCEPASGRAIDQVLVLPMHGPRSFTGEDVVEIHCHGGTLITDLVLRTLLAAGARAARPGEFTERAFLNGKLDLCQAEAVADLVDASSDAGRVAAWHQLEGALSRKVLALRASILDLRALVEAYLDFPEDDLPPEAESEVAAGLAGTQQALAALAATFARGRLAREGIRVALAGKPNVGKSSLLNALLGRERALVSPEAGTTRDYLEEPAALGSLRILLCDTAGLRSGAGDVELAGIERTRNVIAMADVVVVVLDASAALDAEDHAVLEATAGKPRVLVRNKSDLVPVWPNDGTIIDVSALRGAGLEALGSAVAAAALPGAVLEPPAEAVVVTRARHHVALLAAAEALRRSELALESGQALEIVACELQAAIVELERLVGSSDVDDLLDRIFSRFCVGK